MVDTCASKSTKAAISCPSMTTGASFACPTNCATGSGFRNGMGVTPFCSFGLTALFWVGFGLGLQRECFAFTACDLRGV